MAYAHTLANAKPGSLLHRLWTFFEQNPNTHLTLDEVCERFGTSRRVASVTLSHLKNCGVCKTERVTIVRALTNDELFNT